MIVARAQNGSIMPEVPGLDEGIVPTSYDKLSASAVIAVTLRFAAEVAAQVARDCHGDDARQWGAELVKDALEAL